MTGAIHACIGAGLGALVGKKPGAFLAGVLSHVLTDAVPHKDFKPRIEIPLLAAAMFGIARWRGTDSPEFWGALGAISPDFEHGLMTLGIIGQEQEIFPTHLDDGKFHGQETDERWSQVLFAGASLLAVAIKPRSED